MCFKLHLSSPSTAEAGKRMFWMNWCLSAQQRTSATAALPAERSTHTHTGSTEESTAQQITELQLTCWANQDSQPYTSLTRGSQRIVRLTGVYNLPLLICGIVWLRCCSGGVSAENLQRRQEIKCSGLHAVKCVYKVFVRGRRIYMRVKTCPLSVFFLCGSEGSWLFCLVTDLRIAFGEHAYECALMDQSLQGWGDREGRERDAHCSASGPQVTDCCVDVSTTVISHADYNALLWLILMRGASMG